MVDRDTDTRPGPRSGQADKKQARRAREAEALRRNLGRRKAQIRDRMGPAQPDKPPDEEPSDK